MRFEDGKEIREGYPWPFDLCRERRLNNQYQIMRYGLAESCTDTIDRNLSHILNYSITGGEWY